MTATRGTTEHFWAIDAACGGGAEVEVDGKTWIFSPLTFRDGKDIVQHARSEALKAYWAASEDRPRDYQQGNIDLNTILFGAAPQMSLTDPSLRMLQVKLSLRKEQPKVTDADVDKMFDDEDVAKQLWALVEALTYGPFTEEQLQGEGDGEANPTQPEVQPPGGDVSAT